ncbi:long-chain fatty acid transport protein 2-like isoform X2 [Ostrea edulis]|uniref:long-chain fatty acid transport protein 2-like isoform X2 n=1 Tax=Ostrea edulis TaxID=37623 RepID=UPI002094DEE1|nr:long-chain fatty acid transport protein 2-like isoform X2 [Ostrea edulis]
MRGNMWTIVMGALAGLLGASYLGIKYWMPWLIYDLQFLWVILNGYLIPMTSDIKNRKLTIDRVEETVQRYPNKPMLVYGNTTFTYSECNAFANKVASTALSLGLKRGDVVAIILANEPDFVWTMIGLQKIGVQMAFINYNLRNESLVHVIKIAEPKMIFVSREKEIQRPVTDIHQALTGIPVYHFGEADDPNFLPLDPILEKSSEQNVGEDIRKQIRMTDNSLYIYTSGTTGLPKAAYIPTEKIVKAAWSMASLNLSSDDIVYTALPLYHSSASLLALGNVLRTGATMVLKKKFSASNFIKDCRENKVTVVHYVGELFRYVSATPPNSSDTDHCIRCAFGNGLRIDVWKIMLERFKIPHIYEFYAATEMPVGLANISNTVGSVGRMSPLLKLTLPCEFVLYDEENENVVRTKEGLCMLAPLESPGLLLIKLDEKRRMTFEGYKGKESERKKKLVYNVLRQGDCYINTGDALTRDKNYFVYFADRLGDTFRWKGENVSTTEVANIFMELDILSDVCVYGVRIGDNEGKGGMAAISLKNQPEDLSLNTEQLLNIAQHCKKHLPSYARPRFIRVVKEFIYTSTFKQSKLKLKEEGYNLAEVASPVYYLDCKENTYTEMTPDVERDITSGTVKM